MKNFTGKIIAILLCAAPYFGVAQEYTLKGVVTAFNAYPLQNVSVEAKKSKAVAATNENGEFELKVDEKDVVIITADGFNPFRKKISNPNENLNVNLVFKETEKDAMRAVGYGYISEENLTYAITHYSHENNSYNQYQDIYELVRSIDPSVSLIRENGSLQFQIRGAKSLMGSNAALVVLDGMPVSDFSFILPSDVAYVEILKGAAASIYGSRGANGVILIETKRR